MKKIAVICARPPERNTGMATVDLAAHAVLRRLAPEAEIMLYMYGTLNQYTYQHGELPYRHLNILEHAESFLGADAFVYWGDFIHSHAYWKFDRTAWAGEGRQQKAEYDNYCKYIFLSGLPDARLKNAAVFGSTIITNDAADLTDDVYAAHYMRFFSGVGAVYFRDALSAAKISPLRGNEATLACDCALLLEDSDLAQLQGFRPAAERRGVGVFFGRSPAKANMLLFASLLGRRMGEECAWLPWFPSRRRVRWLARLFGFRVGAGHTPPGELLSALSGCRFVVTDTYHLCVNAWRMGIPAVCIGAGAKMASTSLDDKKKEIFYEMYGARAFYVFLESLRSVFGFAAALDRAAAALGNGKLAAQVRKNIGLHRDAALRRLKEAVARVISSAAP